MRRLLILLLMSFCNNVGAAEDVFETDIYIEGHKFSPEEVKVPAGRKIRLIVHNKDETVEEFESIDLKREKIIPGNSSTHIILAPLKPGEYTFFGEFHQDTAKGVIIASEE